MVPCHFSITEIQFHLLNIIMWWWMSEWISARRFSTIRDQLTKHWSIGCNITYWSVAWKKSHVPWYSIALNVRFHCTTRRNSCLGVHEPLVHFYFQWDFYLCVPFRFNLLCSDWVHKEKNEEKETNYSYHTGNIVDAEQETANAPNQK